MDDSLIKALEAQAAQNKRVTEEANNKLGEKAAREAARADQRMALFRDTFVTAFEELQPVIEKLDGRVSVNHKEIRKYAELVEITMDVLNANQKISEIKISAGIQEDSEKIHAHGTYIHRQHDSINSRVNWQRSYNLDKGSKQLIQNDILKLLQQVMK